MGSWAEQFDAIIRGDRKPGYVWLGPTPQILQNAGLGPGRLVMTSGKIAKCRKDHPEVSRADWHKLPDLLTNPKAIFPSSHDDQSIVVAVAARDADGNPIIVAILPQPGLNVILSLYGKKPRDGRSGDDWIDSQIALAVEDNRPVIDQRSAGTLPQPELENSSSPGSIPADGPAERNRDILSIRTKVKDLGDS